MSNTSAAFRDDEPSRAANAIALFRAALPFVRPLLLAGVVTLLIMVGLPTFLAIASSASVR